MLSISCCCEASLSGALEYCSSTGRLRNKQPVVGRVARMTARNRKAARGNLLRLVKILRCSQNIGVHCARKVAGLQRETPSQVLGPGCDAPHSALHSPNHTLNQLLTIVAQDR